MLLTWLLSFSGYGQADKGRKLRKDELAGQTLATVCAMLLMWLYRTLKWQKRRDDLVHILHASGEK